MITDKNILASKHSPHPWNLHKDKFQVVSAIIPSDGIRADVMYGIVSTKIESNGTYVSMGIEERLANACLISAAPEAIEFIADLMEFFDFLEL